MSQRRLPMSSASRRSPSAPASSPMSPPTTPATGIKPVQAQAIPQPIHPAYHADVALSVYSLNGASAMNKVTELAGLGGAYHVGIEIFCLEWSFGWTPLHTGVHNVYAGCSEAGTFKERILLGQTPCSPHAILGIIGAMREAWPGTSYHMLRRNCAHFSMELVRQLEVREFPEWVNSLASLLLWLTQWADAPGIKASQDPLRLAAVEAAPDPVSPDGAEAAVASELDWKEAQEYMLERAADAVNARRRRILSKSNSEAAVKYV